MTPRTLLTILLPALLLAAGTVHAQNKAVPVHPGEEPRFVDVVQGPVTIQFVNDPSDVDAFAPLVALRGGTTTIWMRFLPNEVVNDTVNVTASGGATVVENASFDVALDPSAATWQRIRLAVPGNLTDSVTVRVNFATTENIEGGNHSVPAIVQTIAPVSALLKTDPMYREVADGSNAGPFYRDGVQRRLQTGHETRVTFTVTATNHGDAVTTQTFGLYVNGYKLLGTAEVTLQPGESKDVQVHRFLLADDLPEYASGYGVGSSYVYVNFGLAMSDDEDAFDQQSPSPTDGRAIFTGDALYRYPAYEFTASNGSVKNVRGQQDALQAEFYFGVLAKVTDTHLSHGDASWVVVEVTNYGSGTARGLRIDVSAWPDPAAYYGPGTYVKESRRVSLGPGESTSLNITFSAKVAGTYQVKTQAYLGTGNFAQPEPVVLPTPVTINITDDLVRLGERGETLTATMVVNSSTDLRDARLGLALATSNWYGRDGVPFARFLTADDVMELVVPDATFDLVGNGKVWVNASFTPKAAGNWMVIPYLQVGDLVYTARGDPNATAGGGGGGRGDVPVGEPFLYPSAGTSLAHYEVRVLADGINIPLLWAPVGLVSFGFAGYWVYRRGNVK